jgi:hypothetical protein
MWYPDDVEHIEGLAGLVERWVLRRWRARPRRRPLRRTTQFSDDFGRSTHDVLDWAPRSGVEGLHMTPQANAKPPSSRSSRPALLAAYTRWCDERARVTDAYRDWADSNAAEDTDAWQAYELALDHLETAYIRAVLLTEWAAVCHSQPDSAARVESKAWRSRPTRRWMIGT